MLISKFRSDRNKFCKLKNVCALLNYVLKYKSATQRKPNSSKNVGSNKYSFMYLAEVMLLSFRCVTHLYGQRFYEQFKALIYIKQKVGKNADPLLTNPLNSATKLQ